MSGVCYLLRDYGLRVNTKKVYRICRESGLLLPRPKKKRRKGNHEDRICDQQKDQWTGISYGNLNYKPIIGVIHGENRAFYFLAFIDVFSREVVGYHLGLSCRTIHLKMALNEALRRCWWSL